MKYCPCMSHKDAPSTHRAARHFDPRCEHSELRRTTTPRRRRPMPGQRRLTRRIEQRGDR